MYYLGKTNFRVCEKQLNGTETFAGGIQLVLQDHRKVAGNQHTDLICIPPSLHLPAEAPY